MWAFPPAPGYPPGPAGYPQQAYHPHAPMMAGYPPPPGMKPGKGMPEPAGKSRRRKKKVPQGGPKKPATSFVLFSNTVREEVKAANPGLSFIELGRKLGEMWREMDPAVRKDYEDRATAAKDRYLEEKKIWLAQRAAGMTQD
mmetsp:Transcript_39063/g.92139  ORF Transcript_39063/g.92139 Transcript_39063/m.92139 type:complete len:142 (-) Transcript_39063:141-566(-)